VSPSRVDGSTVSVATRAGDEIRNRNPACSASSRTSTPRVIGALGRFAMFGVYASVVHPGVVAVGDIVEVCH
jgi:hypothetical protein